MIPGRNLEEKLSRLPDKPGVYLMKNANGKVIYVGKAKVLKNRVRQYFQNSAHHTPKVRAMVDNIADFEYIITASEREAFILECNLIKEYRPHYNILLKDDKTYPFIRLSSEEEYPRFTLTRWRDHDKSDYFGPYTSAYFCRETIELANKIFHLPQCRRHFPEDFGKKRPCLYHSMGRCMGVCTGRIGKDAYGKIIRDAAEFVRGKHTALLNRLEEEMNEAADKLQFERAADLRDKINAIRYVSQKQTVTLTNGGEADVVALAAEDNDVAFEVLFIRDGKMTGRESFCFEGASGIDDALLMENFLTQFYAKEERFVPPLVVLSHMAADMYMMAEHLSDRRQSTVEVRCAVRGRYRSLASMAEDNAKKTLADNREQKMRYQLKKSAAAELGALIGLSAVPARIEAYDISHISGDAMVGAMVVFCDGRYSKADTRYFKLKTVDKNNDYAALREVLTRRFAHCLEEYTALCDGTITEEKAKFALLPDVILMDGGEGQMNIARSVLDGMGLDIPVFGMVKDDRHRTRGLVSPDGEINIRPSCAAFRLITCIQDEVHRLAIGYHHKLKEKAMITSPLLDIRGVGEKTYAKLMKHYKTVAAIRAADEKDLAAVVGKIAAAGIYAYYHKGT